MGPWGEDWSKGIRGIDMGTKAKLKRRQPDHKGAVDADWRKAPRKPADEKATKTISFRVTEEEFNELRLAARGAGQTVRAFVLQRCLG